MNKNDLFELTITDIGMDGEGIGKYEGMTFFVKDAVVGDVIRAKAIKLKKNYGYARVEEVLTPSTFRIEPKCANHRACGGCQIQQIDYERQLIFKQNKVLNNLVRLGGFDADEIKGKMLPIIGMKEPFRYRNKAQFPVGYDKNGDIVFGFYASRSHNIIPIEDCYLGVKENERILEIIKAWMDQFKVKPYDEETGKGILRHVLIRYGFTTDEIMVCLIVNAKKLLHGDELADMLSLVDGMTSISYNINMDKTNKILGDKTVNVWGKDYITDYIHLKMIPDYSKVDACESTYTEDFVDTGIKVGYNISPQSFYQVNPLSTEKLYSTALDFAGLTGNESVWDLYCGIGTISLFLAQKAKMVYGVEIVPQAIEDANSNAKLNGISNAKFFVGKAEEVLPEFYKNNSKSEDSQMLSPDVIVVDPPRKGCDEKCLDTMLKMKPERIVYVSCDSATLSRDLRILVDGGYELVKVQAVDQFAHTTHVETCVLLTKSSEA